MNKAQDNLELASAVLDDQNLLVQSPNDGEGSKTALTGQKRPIELTQGAEWDHGPDDDKSLQRSYKRVKQNRDSSTAADSDDGLAINNANSLDDSTLVNAQPQVTGTSTFTWNKGVQSGLRTSFGAKRQSNPLERSLESVEAADDLTPELSSNEDEPEDGNGDELHSESSEPHMTQSDDSSGNENRQEARDENTASSTVSRPQNGRDITKEKSTKPVQFRDATGKVITFKMFKAFQKMSKKKKKALPSLERDAYRQFDLTRQKSRQVKRAARLKSRLSVASAEKASIANVETQPEGEVGIAKDRDGRVLGQQLDKTSAREPSQPLPKEHVPVAPSIHGNGEEEDSLPTELRDLDGSIYTANDLIFGQFIPDFFRENEGKWTRPSKKEIAVAFNVYINKKYAHLPQTTITAMQGTFDTVAHGRVKAYFQELKDEQRIRLDRDNPNGQIVTAVLNGESSVEELAPMDLENNEAVSIDQSDLQSVGDGDFESGEIMDAALQAKESELLQIYFPSTSSQLSNIDRCLACAGIGHVKLACPLLSCTSCTPPRNHSSLQCPKTQRCGKCRERGHGISDCPEKLSRAKTEAVACDLCGSLKHVEASCHFIWRSFLPKPEEIRTVREISAHCYSCGGTGHYGPECGLYSGRLPIERRTWSTENMQRYIDPSSQDRALSAGIDYSIQKRSQSLSIKGKANAPIFVESSEEDQEFIRPKVGASGNQQGHIRFGNFSASSREPPPGRGLPSTYRNFRPEGDAPRFDSERDLSPPPQYRDDPFTYNYADDDRRYNSTRPRNGDYSYRPGPERAAPSANLDPRRGPSGRGRGGKPRRPRLAKNSRAGR